MMTAVMIVSMIMMMTMWCCESFRPRCRISTLVDSLLRYDPDVLLRRTRQKAMRSTSLG